VAEPIKGYDQLGNRVSIPADQLAAAEREGYRVATPEDLALEVARDKYGGIPGEVGAAVTGALSGATLGLSDVALAKLGADEAIKAYQTLPELQTTRFAGELVGGIAPALLTGGETAAAKIATTIGKPALLAERAGQAAVARLGLAGAEGVAGTAGRWAVQAGVESAIQGIGQETARLAVDNQLSGEKLGQIAGAGLVSGLAGAGIGGALGALGGGARSIARKAADTFIPPDIEASEWGPRLKEALYSASAKLKGVDPDAARAIARDPELERIALDAKDYRANIIEGKQAGPLERRVAQANSQQVLINELWDANERAADLVRDGSLKFDLVAEHIGNDLAAQRAAVAEQIATIRGSVQEMLDAGKDQFSQTGLKKLTAQLDNAEEKIASAIGASDEGVQLMQILDVDLKREFGKVRKGFSKATNDAAAIRTMERLGDVYEGLRTTLESKAVWGDIADFQRQLNAPLTRAFSVDDAFMNNWFEKTPFGRHPTDPWRQGRIVSPTKIEANALAATKPGTDTADLSLRRALSDQKEWQAKMLEFGDFSAAPGMREVLEQNQARITKILDNQDKLIKAARAEDFLNQWQGGNDSFGAMLAGAAVASGSPLVALFAPMLKPRLMMRGAQAVEGIANQANGRIGSAVGRAAKSISDGAVAAAERVPVAGATAVRYEERSKRVRELQAQAPAVRAKLEQETAWLGETAPVARQAAISTALRQLDYLSRNMPPGLAAATPFAPRLPPSRQQMQAWLARVRAVENPTSILDDLAEGKLTPEAIDAVREVYPETFADMQAKVVDKLSALESSGKRPSYAQRIQLGLLLGIPTDPLMAPETLRAIQGQYQATPGAERAGMATPQPQKAPNFAAAFRSGSAELEERQ